MMKAAIYARVGLALRIAVSLKGLYGVTPKSGKWVTPKTYRCLVLDGTGQKYQ